MEWNVYHVSLFSTIFFVFWFFVLRPLFKFRAKSYKKSRMCRGILGDALPQTWSPKCENVECYFLGPLWPVRWSRRRLEWILFYPKYTVLSLVGDQLLWWILALHHLRANVTNWPPNKAVYNGALVLLFPLHFKREGITWHSSWDVENEGLGKVLCLVA